MTQTTLRFEPPLSPPAIYVVTVRVEGVEHVCSNADYEGGAAWACGGQAFPLMNDDSTDQANSAELAGVQISGRSERYTVTVTKDGSEILTQDMKPVYDEDEPNGPGCGICAQGEALIEVP